MSERDRTQLPEWARRERTGDLAWIGENIHVFWPVAQHGFQEHGRGASVVDTTIRPTGGGHPFAYLPEVGIEQMNEADAIRMVKAYDPTWECDHAFQKPGSIEHLPSRNSFAKPSDWK